MTKIQTILNEEAVREFMVMDLEQKIASFAADGIETDSNNIFLNIGKSYKSCLNLPVDLICRPRMECL